MYKDIYLLEMSTLRILKKLDVKPSKDHGGGDKEEHCILPARRIAAGPDIHYTQPSPPNSELCKSMPDLNCVVIWHPPIYDQNVYGLGRLHSTYCSKKLPHCIIKTFLGVKGSMTFTNLKNIKKKKERYNEKALDVF